MLLCFLVEEEYVDSQAHKEKEEDKQGENGVNAYPLHLFEIMFKHELTFV